MRRSGNNPSLVVVGAGGMGREIWSMVAAINSGQEGPQWHALGVLADDEPDAAYLERLNAPYLGKTNQLENTQLPAGTRFVIGVGNSRSRRQLTNVLRRSSLSPVDSLISPSADIGVDVELGAGTVVCAGAVITTNVRAGEGAQINIGCTVSHDVRLGEYVTLAPQVALAGNVQVGDGAFIGTSACVLPGCLIGEGAVVGAGAVVTADVPSGATVVGVPARAVVS